MKNFIRNLFIVAAILFAIYFLGGFNKCNAQNTGGNGGGFFENYDQDAEKWLKELNQPFTLRIPGGPIDKFADPAPERGGWGLTHEGIDSIQIKYGSPDEEEQAGALDKWHGKASEQPDHSYLDDLIALQKTFPELRVIWSANVFIPADRTVSIISYMISHGVNVVAVEMGNETYSQLDYNFSNYSTRASAIRTAIKNIYPDLPISHISAPIGKGRREQDLWNSQLSAWLPAGDWVTQHYYIGEREILSMSDLPDRKTVNFNSPDATLQNTFVNIAAELLGYQTIVISTADSLFPGHTRIITETNTQPAALIGDTYLNSAYQFRFLMENKDHYNSITWHNFVSPDIYGMICLRKKNEPGTERLKKRTTYFSFDLQGDIPARSEEITPEGLIDFRTPGTYYFWFENLRGNPYTPQINLVDVILDSVKIRSASAPFLSSNEISITTTGINEIPSAYGYIQYFISPKKITPPPCVLSVKCKRFFYALFNSKKCRCSQAI